MNQFQSIFDKVKEISCYTRFPGTEGSTRSLRYIVSFLEGQNVDSSMSITKIPNWILISNPTVKCLSNHKIDFKAIPAMFSYPSPKEGVEGYLKAAGTIKMLDSFDWEQFAITSREDELLGYLISTSYGAHMEPLPFSSSQLPVVIIDSKSLEALKNVLSLNKNITVHVVNPTTIVGEVAVNSIISHCPLKQPAPMICAHYDTVYNSVGAHDNASGVAVVMHLITNSDLKERCRFAFFDGEESNKAGSTNYVNEERCNGNLKNVSFVLEIDSVGLGEEIVLLCSKSIYKKVRNLADDLAKHISPQFKLTISQQTRISFCDVWPFMQEGIPVIRMLSRDATSSKIIHSDDDTIDIIKPLTLEAASNIAHELAHILFHN